MGEGKNNSYPPNIHGSRVYLSILLLSSPSADCEKAGVGESCSQIPPPSPLMFLTHITMIYEQQIIVIYSLSGKSSNIRETFCGNN